MNSSFTVKDQFNLSNQHLGYLMANLGVFPMPTLNDFIVLQASVDALQLHEVHPQVAASLTEGIEKATAKAIELLLAERLPKHAVNKVMQYYFHLDGDTLSIYSPNSQRLLYLSYDDWE